MQLIELNGINFHRNGRPILSDVNLSVNKGEFLAITGPNGGGKTSLLRIMLGLLKPDSGTVSITKPAPVIGYLPQTTSIDPAFPVTVQQVIATGLLDRHIDKRRAAEMVANALELTNLTPLADRTLGKLSGGQRQRTLLARAIVRQPDLLVLDEPLSYLDAASEHHVVHILNHAIEKGATVVLVSHEMTAFAPMATHHVIVDRNLTICKASHHHIPDGCHCADPGCQNKPFSTPNVEKEYENFK